MSLGALAPSRREPPADRWAGLDREAPRPQTARRPPARVPRALSVRAPEVTEATTIACGGVMLRTTC